MAVQWEFIGAARRTLLASGSMEWISSVAPNEKRNCISPWCCDPPRAAHYELDKKGARIACWEGRSEQSMGRLLQGAPFGYVRVASI
jgi:hypothetical protein